MPFLIVSVEGALRRSILGTTRRRPPSRIPLVHVTRVTLPMLAPGVGAGAVLCWARALGEFGATITFAGSFPGTTQTSRSPSTLALENDLPAAIALSLVLLVVSVAILAACANVGSGHDP